MVRGDMVSVCVFGLTASSDRRRPATPGVYETNAMLRLSGYCRLSVPERLSSLSHHSWAFRRMSSSDRPSRSNRRSNPLRLSSRHASRSNPRRNSMRRSPRIRRSTSRSLRGPFRFSFIAGSSAQRNHTAGFSRAALIGPTTLAPGFPRTDGLPRFIPGRMVATAGYQCMNGAARRRHDACRA